MTLLPRPEGLPLPGPADWLPAGALSLIRAEAAAAEELGDLTPAMLGLIYKEGWFKMLVPKRLGGGAFPLPQVVRLEEGLAYADGSLGWVVTLCSGAGWFGGMLPPRVFDELLADTRLCLAGSGSATGQAHLIGDNYIVSGNWPYASGIDHATAYTANCVIWKDGVPLQTADGKPVIKAFLFLPGEVRVRDDWNAMGLKGTGSHGFSVDQLAVTHERAFVIDPEMATDADPLYQYPFLPLAEVTLAANIAGMGCHFLDCCEEYFEEKGRPEPLSLLAAARLALGETRGHFYRAVDDSWERPSTEALAAVGRISHGLATTTREWVDILYPFAGLGATRINTTINRVWRDLHTAGQHPLLVY